jgi:CheY-like chemotaxis protein
MFTDQLREAGYRVLEASDADKALDLLRHAALNIAVVISDVDMPGSMNGIGLAHVIRLERPLIKTILVSGHEMPLDGVQHDAFFPKPYNAPAIILRVKALLGWGTLAWFRSLSYMGEGVLSQETILVVEDEVLVRMPIAQYLRDCGYKVIEAANADEAITVLSHKETVVDVVFTDIEMPGALDGFGLAKWVREHRHGVDGILAGTLPRTVKQAEELCEEAPLPKPCEAQTVHNQIRRLLAARKGASG